MRGKRGLQSVAHELPGLLPIRAKGKQCAIHCPAGLQVGTRRSSGVFKKSSRLFWVAQDDEILGAQQAEPPTPIALRPSLQSLPCLGERSAKIAAAQRCIGLTVGGVGGAIPVGAAGQRQEGQPA